MRKKIAKILALALLPVMCLTLSGFQTARASETTTITLDGQFTDWANVPTLLTNKETWYPDFLNKGATYYWNNDTDAWQTEALDNACMYNEGRALDLGTIKFANNADYLYFYWEKNSDYMNYFWKTFPNDSNNTTIDEASFTSGPVSTLPDAQANQSSPPCANETIYNPANYDHDMVYALDTNLDLKNDYYLVMNIVAPQGTPGSDYSYAVTTYIYQDNGDGIYNGRGTETLVSNLGSDYEQYPSAGLCKNGVCQEGRVKINTFFTDLGLKWGSSVIVNYEAHSAAKLYSTKKSVYTFNKKNKFGLRVTAPKQSFVKTTKKSIILNGTLKKAAKVNIFRNKKQVYKLANGKKFSKTIALKKGRNVIKIKAQNGSKKFAKVLVIVRTK